MSATPRLLTSGAQACFGVYPDDTFVAIFRGRNRTQNIADMETALMQFARERSARIRVLVVIEAHSTIGQRGRQRIAAMLKAADPFVGSWVNVIEGTGFWASTARTIGAGVRLLSRTSFTLEIKSTVDDAARWLATRNGAPIPADYAAAIDGLRASITSPRAK